MMERTINVKGTGKISAAPDLIAINVTLRAQDMDYAKAMELSASQTDALRTAITELGFERSDLKTASFNVSTNYEGEHDANGNYRNKFAGYVCTHGLSLEFDMDTERLAEVLNAVSRSLAEPELSIIFTVKDKDALSEKLLASAVKNAREKAEILAASAGVSLGELISVNYNWGDLNAVSPTRYARENAAVMGSFKAMDIEPQDITVTDTVSLTWAIS